MVRQSCSFEDPCSCQTPRSSPCTHSSLVSKGFSSPPPQIKIPQLLLWVVSLAYRKSKMKQKTKGKKSEWLCNLEMSLWSSRSAWGWWHAGTTAPGVHLSSPELPTQFHLQDGGEVCARNVNCSPSALKGESVCVWRQQLSSQSFNQSGNLQLWSHRLRKLKNLRTTLWNTYSQSK